MLLHVREVAEDRQPQLLRGFCGGALDDRGEPGDQEAEVMLHHKAVQRRLAAHVVVETALHDAELGRDVLDPRGGVAFSSNTLAAASTSCSLLRIFVIGRPPGWWCGTPILVRGAADSVRCRQRLGGLDGQHRAADAQRAGTGLGDQNLERA